WPLTPPTAHAQAPIGNTPVKEVQIAADAFVLGEPVPPWVESSTIPDAASADPLVLRLLDTQYLVGSTSVVYVRRALQINDAASLTRAGQVGIQFVPQYNQLKLHTLRVLRGAETLDRMATYAVRFLQRER